MNFTGIKISPAKCVVPGCPNPPAKIGYSFCPACYKAYNNAPPAVQALMKPSSPTVPVQFQMCKWPKCTAPANAGKDYCNMCYMKYKQVQQQKMQQQFQQQQFQQQQKSANAAFVFQHGALCKGCHKNFIMKGFDLCNQCGAGIQAAAIQSAPAFAYAQQVYGMGSHPTMFL